MEGSSSSRQRQKALSWQLRAATSLSRLLQKQDRQRDAAATLRPVYDRFTEGFEIADLIAAKRLLDELRRDESVVPAKPKLWARDIACARFSTFSLMKMCFTCDFTVSGAIVKFRAISLFDCPSAINLSIASSRTLNDSTIAEV
jgi:hypothetical protein